MGIPTEAALPEGAIEIDMTPGSGKVPTVANGEHPATLCEVGSMTSAFDATKLTTVLKFVVDGQDAERDGTLNVTPSRTTKGAFPWSTILTALKIDHAPGTKLNVSKDTLVGKRVKLFVMNEPGKRDPSKLFPRIKAVLAA